MKVIGLLLCFACSEGLSQQASAELFPVNFAETRFSTLSQRLEDPSTRFVSPDLDEGVTAGKKSVALAGLYSFLLPGMGELYAGEYSSGKYFTIAEGLLWLSLGAVEMQASSMQEDARSFAAQHAGVSVSGKDDEYFVDIGNYNNTYSYNTAVSRARQYFDVYDPMSAFAWQWDVDVNRTAYRDMRVASDEMYNNTKFVAGVIVINHLVSAINAIRVTLAHNKSLDEAGLIDLHASLIGPISRPDGLMLSFSKRF